MSNIETLKSSYLREIFRRMGLASGVSVRHIYEQLSTEQHANLKGYAQQLSDNLDPKSDRSIDPVLLEMACMIPGAMRGKPEFMATQSPAERPMYASELQEAGDWLQKAENLADSLRRLTPEQRDVLFPDNAERSTLGTHTVSSLLLDALDNLLPADDEQEIYSSDFDELNREEGQELARFALLLFDTDLPRAADVADDIVLWLACLVPEALRGLHTELVKRDLFSYSGVIFLGADAEARDMLLDNLRQPDINEGNLLNWTLVALAWIGDEVTQRTFQRWREEPPSWRSSLYVPPEEYAMDAAWELTEAGTRRDLFFETCYALVPSDESRGPVSVLVESEEKCGSCGQSLIVLLDFDLTDPRLAFLEMSGKRLRISTCDRCGVYSSVYLTDIDLHGKSHWSPDNEPPDVPSQADRRAFYDSFAHRLGIDKELSFEELSATSEDAFYTSAKQKLVLDSTWKRPQESLALEGSQVGGYPAWVQDSEYPKCPKCGRTMVFIAQVVTSDIMGELAEGTTFALICPEYHTAATVYQQT